MELRTSGIQVACRDSSPECDPAGALYLARMSLEPLDHMVSLNTPLEYGTSALLAVGQSSKPPRLMQLAGM